MKAVAIALIIGITSLPVLHFILIKYFLMPQIVSDNQKTIFYLPSILTDFKTVSESYPFAVYTFNHNAGEIISKYVSWEFHGEGALASVDHTTLRELFNKYPQWKNDAKAFQALYTDPKLMEIDATWIDQLNDVDHWDYTHHPLFENELKKVPGTNGVSRIGIFANLPIPNFSEYRQWATIFLLQKSQQGKIDEGLIAFRKMAHLSHSVGSLVGNMIAIAMLKDEYVLASHLQFDNWEFIPQSTIEAFKRVVWAWPGLARYTWFNNLPKELEPYLTPQAGVCTAGWELPGGLSSFQDFLEDTIFFEKNFSKNLQHSKEFQNKLFSLCNLKQFEAFVAPLPAGANLLSKVPYARQIIGLHFINTSNTNFFKLYEQPPK